MDEIIDKLSHILQEIESYHGVIQDGSSHRYVRRLHQQARDHVTELRKSLQEVCEETTPIVAAMVASEMVYSDNSGYCECHYCTLSGVPFQKRRNAIQPADHDTDCPIHLAAAWLEQYNRKADE